MMRCLKYVSTLALLAMIACNRNPYRHLYPVAKTADIASALACKPKISRELYRCVVDGKFLFKRFHLSGILFFKQFEDGSTRAVFQNELGIAFFDFKWNAQDSFEVVRVMQQLDKPAIIKTLRTDLGLLLMKGLFEGDEVHLAYGRDAVSRFPMATGYGYYRQRAGRITTIEYGAKSSVTTIDLDGAASPTELAPYITFTHHRAHFSIMLSKLSKDDQ